MPRPREFDEAEVVQKAMDVFWRNGFTAASLQELVSSTGVHRASLYGEFKDKRSLFLRCLTHYRQEVVPGRLVLLEAPGGGVEAIRTYFNAVVDDLMGAAKGRGCLVVNSAIELASVDEEVQNQVSLHLARLEQAFVFALNEGQKKGEIGSELSVESLSRFLTSASQGLMVTGKAIPDRKMLSDIVASTLALLG